MTKPATYDLQWVRGTTTPLLFAMRRNGVPLPFDEIRITFSTKQGQMLFRATYSNDGGIIVIDPSTGMMQFTPTAAQTRMLIESRDGVTPKNKYEIEYRNGQDEEVYLMGDVLAIGGINDDEVEPS